MNNIEQTVGWKKVLKWLAMVLASFVVLDWLLDGRLRKRLPLRRKANQEPPPIQ